MADKKKALKASVQPTKPAPKSSTQPSKPAGKK